MFYLVEVELRNRSGETFTEKAVIAKKVQDTYDIAQKLEHAEVICDDFYASHVDIMEIKLYQAVALVTTFELSFDMCRIFLVHSLSKFEEKILRDNLYVKITDFQPEYSKQIEYLKTLV